VMVLDLKMPGIDGIEVLRRAKRDQPKIEIIILTGHGSDREREIALELGAFAYLQKPVDIDILAQTMKGAYRKIGKLDQPRKLDELLHDDGGTVAVDQEIRELGGSLPLS